MVSCILSGIILILLSFHWWAQLSDKRNGRPVSLQISRSSLTLICCVNHGIDRSEDPCFRTSFHATEHLFHHVDCTRCPRIFSRCKCSILPQSAPPPENVTEGSCRPPGALDILTRNILHDRMLYHCWIWRLSTYDCNGSHFALSIFASRCDPPTSSSVLLIMCYRDCVSCFHH
jgi:hypothetical protein